MAQTETHMVRDVTGKLYDMHILKQLHYLYEHYLDIRETNYLRDFSMLETLEIFNPKYIIRDLLKIYMRNVTDIACQPDLLQKYIFKFHEEDMDVRTFEISNNMMLRHDITTLCFLYHISYKREFDQCETMQILKSLMFNKYGIALDGTEKKDNTDPTQKQKKFLLLEIAFSFPSITWNIIRDFGMWTKFFDKFSDFDLPKIIFIPMIFSLLPQLKEQPPLAILLAIVLRTNEFRDSEINKKWSLREICNDIDISLSYKNKLFPERLKLELCKKWQIIMIEKGIYKYNPNFEAHRQKAKDIIAKMKPDDPNLELILSKL